MAAVKMSTKNHILWQQDLQRHIGIIFLKKILGIPISPTMKLHIHKDTQYLGLWYPNGSGIEVYVYADLDQEGDYVDRKSTSGVCTIVGKWLTLWCCKKQMALAISITKAEYVAAERAYQQSIRMKQAIKDYDTYCEDVLVLCDNKGRMGDRKPTKQYMKTFRGSNTDDYNPFVSRNYHEGHANYIDASLIQNTILKHHDRGETPLQHNWDISELKEKFKLWESILTTNVFVKMGSKDTWKQVECEISPDDVLAKEEEDNLIYGERMAYESYLSTKRQHRESQTKMGVLKNFMKRWAKSMSCKDM
ncbi:hypothetical protein Tco_0047946 [Tanacetum coccineum]